jgi:hypothetical protein
MTGPIPRTFTAVKWSTFSSNPSTMKKPLLLPAMGLLLLSLIACKKDLHLTGFLPGGISAYQLKTFRFATGINNYDDTLTFTYDHFGNPVTVTRSVPYTGAPNYAFGYDKNHRLTAFYGTYTSGHTAEIFHKYFYDAQGHITLDSVYSFADHSGDTIIDWIDRYAFGLQYDEYGRVSAQFNPSDTLTRTSYLYDGRGNLETGATYDDKVNFHRTNWVWMFIDRDFSLNNPFKATSYTIAGLPTHFIPSVTESFKGFLGNNIYWEAWITYEPR